MSCVFVLQKVARLIRFALDTLTLSLRSRHLSRSTSRSYDNESDLTTITLDPLRIDRRIIDRRFEFEDSSLTTSSLPSPPPPGLLPGRAAPAESGDGWPHADAASSASTSRDVGGVPRRLVRICTAATDLRPHHQSIS